MPLQLIELKAAIQQIGDEQFFVEIYESDPRQHILNVWEGAILKEVAAEGLIQPYSLATRGVIVNYPESASVISGLSVEQLEQGVRGRPSLSALIQEVNEIEGDMDF